MEAVGSEFGVFERRSGIPLLLVFEATLLIEYFLGVFLELGIMIVVEWVELAISFERCLFMFIFLALNLPFELCLFLRTQLHQFSHCSLLIKFFLLLNSGLLCRHVHIQQQQCFLD